MRKKIKLIGVFIVMTLSCYAQIPNLEWVTQMDTTGFGAIYKPVVDKSGNFYQTYSYSSDSLNLGTYTFYSTDTTQYSTDYVFAKYDRSGQLLWAKQLDSSLMQTFTGIIGATSNNDILISGNFKGTVDFDPDVSMQLMSSAVNGSSYLLRLDSNGSFVWVKKFNAAIQEATIDNYDQLYLIGEFGDFATDFDPGPGITTVSNINNLNNGTNGYIAKLDSFGSLIWVKHFEGSRACTRVQIGQNNDIFLSGAMGYIPIDLDPGPGFYMQSTQPSSIYLSTFFCKLDSSGNFIWGRTLEPNKISNPFENFVLDENDNLYIAGNFNDTVDFDPGLGVYNLISKKLIGGLNEYINEIYLTKWDRFGNFVWAKHIPYIVLMLIQDMKKL